MATHTTPETQADATAYLIRTQPDADLLIDILGLDSPAETYLARLSDHRPPGDGKRKGQR